MPKLLQKKNWLSRKKNRIFHSGNQRRKEATFNLKLTFQWLALIGFIFFIWWLVNNFFSYQWLQLNNVIWQIDNSAPKSLKESLAQKIKPLLNENYLQIDLVAIKKKIKENVWVKKVRITRQFYNDIHIQIHTKKIALRFNNNAYISKEGKYFAPNIIVNSNAPLALGGIKNAKNIYENYQHYQIFLGVSLTIKVIKQYEVTELIIAPNTKVKLGYQFKTERLKRFKKNYPRLMKKYQNLDHAIIDMRYMDGLSVQE